MLTSLKRIVLAIGFVISASVLAACETTSSQPLASLRPVHSGEAMQSASAQHDRWLTRVYGQMESRQTAPDETQPPAPYVQFDGPPALPPTSNTDRIGVYGELVRDGDRPAVGPDGAANLAQVSFATEGGCRSPHVDTSGRLLTFSATMHRPSADIYIKSVDGRTLTQLTADPAEDLTPRFSPTAEHIAFASNRSGNWDIWMISVDGGVPVQVTDSAEHELHPTFSPDGRQIAYCRFGRQSGRWEIWLTDLGRPGVQRFLTYGLFPQWSPDRLRSRIAFQRPRERGSREHSVWTLEFRDGEAMNISEVVSASNAAAMHPSWSPDGSSLVFVTVVEPDDEPGSRPKVADVWTIDADGRNRRNLTQGRFTNLQPTWAMDGRVYFVSDRSGVENIWSVRATDEQTLRTWEEDLAGVRAEH